MILTLPRRFSLQGHFNFLFPDTSASTWTRPHSRVLNFGIRDPWGWITVCSRKHSAYSKMFSSIAASTQ